MIIPKCNSSDKGTQRTSTYMASALQPKEKEFHIAELKVRIKNMAPTLLGQLYYACWRFFQRTYTLRKKNVVLQKLRSSHSAQAAKITNGCFH